MPEPSTLVTGRRTRLLPGQEDAYRRIHAEVPEAVAAALRDAGVVSWRIWQDGRSLFHVIETRDGYAEMLERMASLGPIDADWDALIAGLLDASAGSDTLLPLVWGMDSHRHWGNQPPG